MFYGVGHTTANRADTTLLLVNRLVLLIGNPVSRQQVMVSEVAPVVVWKLPPIFRLIRRDSDLVRLVPGCLVELPLFGLLLLPVVLPLLLFV